jgi:CRISPR system Cascade subunit CasC
VLEFTSAVYYRYAALNLGILKDPQKGHLKALSTEHLRQVLDAFIRATILAVPTARKNSMNAHTLPGYVLGLVRESGQPLQLVNAFEHPITSSRNGLMEPSIMALKEHHDSLKKTWGIQPVVETNIPGKTLEEFCKEILSRG